MVLRRGAARGSHSPFKSWHGPPRSSRSQWQGIVTGTSTRPTSTSAGRSTCLRSLQGAKQKHPKARPRIISDNGPRFIANAIGLRHAERQAGWAAAGDPRGARPEVGGGAEATPNSSSASRLTVSLRLAIGPSNRSSPRVRSLNFRFDDSLDMGLRHRRWARLQAKRVLSEGRRRQHIPPSSHSRP
jgi:hypothetical protein